MREHLGRLVCLAIAVAALLGCASDPVPSTAVVDVETPGELPNPSTGREARAADALNELELRAVCFLWQLEVDGQTRNPYAVVFGDHAARRLAEFVLSYEDVSFAEDVESQISLRGETDPVSLAAPAGRSRAEMRRYLRERSEFLGDGDSGEEFVTIEFVDTLLDGNRDRLFVDLSHPDLPVSDGSSIPNLSFEVGFEPSGEYVEVDPRGDCSKLADEGA